MQKSGIAEKLKEHFNAKDIDELAVKLSIG